MQRGIKWSMYVVKSNGFEKEVRHQNSVKEEYWKEGAKKMRGGDCKMIL